MALNEKAYPELGMGGNQIGFFYPLLLMTRRYEKYKMQSHFYTIIFF